MTEVAEGGQIPVASVTVQPETAVAQTSAEEEAAKKKIILAASLTAVAVVLILGAIVAFLLLRRRKAKGKYAKINETTQRGGNFSLARPTTNTINRSETKKYRLRTPSTRAPPTSTPDERFIDPTRNVLIPLLAPVPTDGGNMGRGPWDVERASTPDPRASNTASDIVAIQQEVGDLARVRLEGMSSGG
ncbi:hypothetical protein HK097_006654, partial [Rhizophlyctis rosea]